jgi:hypothetical protein
MRRADMSVGRSINLALSARGMAALEVILLSTYICICYYMLFIFIFVVVVVVDLNLFKQRNFTVDWCK